MQIEWEEATELIKIGKWSTDRPKIYRTSISPDWKKWVEAVAEANGVTLPYKKKEFNKAASQMFGRAPTKMYKHFKALEYKKFVVPYRHLLVKTSFRPGRIDLDALHKIRACKEAMQEVYDDGLFHLLPVVAYSCKSPKELKKDMKGAWKVIANNSANKNRVLAKNFRPDQFADYCKFPTTLLKNTHQFDVPTMQHLTAYYKGEWSNKNRIYEVSRLVRDTKTMASQLRRAFDPLWSPRRMKEEHDQMSKDINALRYPKTVFPWVSNVNPKTLQLGEYTATMLDNAFAIAEEGSCMSHCVGSYANYSAQGSYLVYSITKNSERSSTVGLYVEKRDNKLRFSFNQHYGKYNAYVKDEIEKSIPDELIKLLNNDQKEKP